MFSKKLFRLIFTLSMILPILISGTRVLADTGGITQGDVEATFQGWNTGLRALRFIASHAAAAPLDGFQRGLIHPLFSDGVHYCVEDWHVILIAWVSGGDSSYTYQDAVIELSPIGTTFILDGVTLSTRQTSIVHRVAPGFFEEEYGFAVGSILSPADMGVGKHNLTWLATFPDEPTSRIKITFYIDPSGAGACAP